MATFLPVPRFLRDYVSTIVAENMVGFSGFIDQAVATIVASAAQSQQSGINAMRDVADGVVAIDASKYLILNTKQIFTVNSQGLLVFNTDLLPQTDPGVKGAVWWNSLFVMISDGSTGT